MNTVEQEQKQARFRNELTELLNKHSMENGSNTPDYQLADYLIGCLYALDEAINKRASWYGRFDEPGRSNVDVTGAEPVLSAERPCRQKC